MSNRNARAYGCYHFETTKDGFCGYKTKHAAVNNALLCGAARVYSPTGRVVWQRGAQPIPIKPFPRICKP